MDLNPNSPAKSLGNTETDQCKIEDSKINEFICSDLDILDNLDGVYFKDNFDPGRYELDVRTEQWLFVMIPSSIN